MKLSAKILTILVAVRVATFLCSYGVLKNTIVDLHIYLMSEVIISLLMLLTAWMLLKYFALDRLIRADNELKRIVEDSDWSRRLIMTGNDEITELAQSVNALLDIVDTSQEELKMRIASRTEKLEHLSEINKNLFSEVNRQRSVEEKLREQEKSLRRFAYYDQLTGLPNRMFFREQVRKLIERSARSGGSLVIMFLDTDKFKMINDTYGHPVGDLVLCHIANQLKRVVKDSDMVARYAGDEFVIFLNNIREKSLVDFMAGKILKAVSVPLNIDGNEISSTFSLGISLYPDNGKTIEELEHSADLAMYHAKNTAGNTYSYAGQPESVLLA